jgi:hypothetical protein
MDHIYWRTQSSTKPLFPDVEWSKPERRDQSGRLGIIGGNKLGFSGVAESYNVAIDTGVGEVRVLLPDALQKTIPKSISDTIYSPSNPSGGLASDALDDMLTLSSWSNGILLAGDSGRNSETAIVYEKFITKYQGPLTITRDAIDLVKNNAHLIVDRPGTLYVASFAQLQKLLQAVYYPKILTFSMQLNILVETLHKFTITYPVTIATMHKDQIIIASGGQIVTQDFSEPMRIWRGEIAARMAVYRLWNPDPAKDLASIGASISNI